MKEIFKMTILIRDFKSCLETLRLVRLLLLTDVCVVTFSCMLFLFSYRLSIIYKNRSITFFIQVYININNII